MRCLSRELRLVLTDILEHIDLITGWCDGLSYDEFVKHPVEYHAVIRALSVIGEAAKSVPDDFRESTPDVPWRELAGMRDVVVHRYFGVQDSYIWDAATEELPPIRRILRPHLAQLDDGDD
jgi:uncharacterized protein with HEPN domain